MKQADHPITFYSRRNSETALTGTDKGTYILRHSSDGNIALSIF